MDQKVIAWYQNKDLDCITLLEKKVADKRHIYVKNIVGAFVR